MSDEFIKILDAIADKFGLAIDWTAENVLPYLEKIAERCIAFETNTSIYYIILWTAIAAVMGIVAAVFTRKASKVRWDDCYAWTYLAIFGLIIFGILAATAVGVAAKQAYDLITCATFPEKILIDYATTLLNGGA